MSLVAFTVSIVLSLIATLLGVLYWYSTSTFHYWKKKGVPFASPVPLLGNVKDTVLLRRNFNDVHQELYDRFDGHRFVGMYMGRRPALLLRDPDLIRNILVRDFVHFHDRDIVSYPEKFPLQKNLLTMKGHQWKTLRKRLSPTFSSSRVKHMFPIILQTSKKLVDCVRALADRDQIVDMQDVLSRYSLDSAGTCIFGVQMDSLENPNFEFFLKSRQVFEGTFSKRMALLANQLLPEYADWLSLDGFGSDVADFFLNVVKDIVDFRLRNNVHQKDLLDALISLRYNRSPCEEKMTKEENILIDSKMENESIIHKTESGSITHKKAENLNLEIDDAMMAGQPFLFLLAGFVNPSITLSFAVHELAVNSSIQAKLRAEIDETLEENGGKFTQESLHNMKYLDQVVSETLRKYPTVQFLRRLVTEPYTIPGTTVTLDEGISVIIPTFALHRDPKHYPDPERFDPERFSEEEKAKRHHYVYLPFGEGPRSCLGMRFSTIQMKLALAAMLSKFEFHVCEQTHIPLPLSPTSFVLESASGYFVRVTNRC